jgi:hypothetical protein
MKARERRSKLLYVLKCVPAQANESITSLSGVGKLNAVLLMSTQIALIRLSATEKYPGSDGKRCQKEFRLAS